MVTKLSFVPGKAVSVYLFTDHDSVSKLTVVLEFLYQVFVTYGVGGNFEWVVSFIPGKSWIIDIDEGPVKPMHLRGGTKCYWLKWDNDWLGGGDNRPVNPMRLREDTSCFSLKWKNDWWGLEHEQFDEALLVTNCIDFAGISYLWLSPSCTRCRPRRVAKWWFVITPVIFFELDGWLKVIFSVW